MKLFLALFLISIPSSLVLGLAFPLACRALRPAPAADADLRKLVDGVNGANERATATKAISMLEMGDKDVPFGKNTDDIVLDICADLDIPVIANFPCGHGDCQATLPIGHEIELHAEGDAPYLRIPEPPVS